MLRHLRRIHWKLLAPALWVSVAVAEIAPMERADPNSRLAHVQLVEKARRGGIDLYFLGDSITRRWGTSDPQYREMYANWRTNFFGWNAGNFGWGGDTVQNVLWRVRHGELEDVHPRVIVLLAGTNNLGGANAAEQGDALVEEVTGGIQAILDTIREKAPGATVILTGIFPRNDGRRGTTLIPTIRRINLRLAKMADAKRIRWVDLSERLADPAGKLVEGVTVDGLHLSLKGYQLWADALKPHLRELLGPPRPSTTPRRPPEIRARRSEPVARGSPATDAFSVTRASRCDPIAYPPSG
jgi:lysophospholipase L1-like esterase